MTAPADRAPAPVVDPTPGLHYARNGLVLPARLTHAEWTRCGAVLAHTQGGILWRLGDWLNYGECSFGEMYAQVSLLTRMTQGVLTSMTQGPETGSVHSTIAFCVISAVSVAGAAG